MKRHIFRIFIIVLAFSLTASFVPLTASACDPNAVWVLSRIGHASTDTVTPDGPSARTVTLTVPNGYSGWSVDLSNGLYVEKASNIENFATSFPYGPTAQVDGAGVVLRVSFREHGDNAQYVTSYTIKVVRASWSGPAFTGTLSKSVTGAMPNASTNDITFSAADFANLYGANGGAAMSGISIEGSNSGCGVLRYRGAVYSAGSFIALGDLYSLTFDATAGGSVVYTVRAYAGTNYYAPIGSVQLQISVNNTSGTNAPAVSYSTAQNTPKALSAGDFSSVCWNATGYELNYITFTPPASYSGALRLNYSSPYNPGTAVAAGTKFVVNGAPAISNLTFVPAQGFAGTVTIPYTGVNVYGATYYGSLIITVTGTAPVSDISYSTGNNAAVKFSVPDFSGVCWNATGGSLGYVYFTLPASYTGALYYNYNASAHTGTPVNGNTAYYAGGYPYIDNISFVPAPNYTGTVTITYTAGTADGRTYTGRVNVAVSQTSGSNYFSDVGWNYGWAAEAINRLYEAGVVNGTGGGCYSPAADVSRGDFVLMLYRGAHFSASTSSNFADVPWGSYYYDAIAAAKALRIVESDDNRFYPDNPLTRLDAMVIIYKTMMVTGKQVQVGSYNDVAGFSDSGQIPGYAQTAVATLVKSGVITGSNGRLNLWGTLSRAEMATVIYRYLSKF